MERILPLEVTTMDNNRASTWKVRLLVSAMTFALMIAGAIYNEVAVVRADDQWCQWSGSQGECIENSSDPCSAHEGFECRVGLGGGKCFCVQVAH
jgi:hypothetical protein